MFAELEQMAKLSDDTYRAGMEQGAAQERRKWLAVIAVHKHYRDQTPAPLTHAIDEAAKP